MDDTSINFMHYQKSTNKEQEIDFFNLPSGIMNNTAMELLCRLIREDEQFQMQEDQS